MHRHKQYFLVTLKGNGNKVCCLPLCIIFSASQEVVSAFMENLSDEELKKESKAESKNDTLSGIINALKCLASRVPKQEEKIRNLELFRLKIILR